MQWKTNIFTAPSGKVGKMFVAEMNRMLGNWEAGKPLERVAIKAVMCMPALLQISHCKARKADQFVCLVCLSDLGSPQLHQVIYDKITAQMIRSIVLKMTGSAGPRHQQILFCSSFSRELDDLCSTITRMTRRLCSEYVDPEGVPCLLACRLIALDKSPCVRPIGVGEVLRRVMVKTALQVTSDYIFQGTGPLHLCKGHISGCEAGSHSMRCLYNDTNTEAILMIDATKVFNSLNRDTALRNIQVMCPPAAPFLVNTYQCDVPLYVDGETLLSKEGTMQGNHMAMPMYLLWLPSC